MTTNDPGTVLVTGPTRGLGRVATLAMAARPAAERPDLILVGRPGPDLAEVTAAARTAGANAHEILPLLLDDLPAERVAPLVAALDDPADFGTPVPVPSVSRLDPSWSTDMWRGPAWINTNYLVVAGLRRHGRHDVADRIAEATIATVGRYYERFGVVFEFYDSTDRTPPTRCDRKGPPREEYDPHKKIDTIRDFHWTAALTLALLAERPR